MTDVKFADKEYLKVSINGGKETNLVMIPVTKDGLNNIRRFLDALLEENKSRDYSQSYKTLDELHHRISSTWSLLTTGMKFTVNDEGNI